MTVSRRRFLAAAAPWAVGWFVARPHSAAAAETRLISWPSRVVQLPADEGDQKPPVVTALRLHRDMQRLATAGDDHCIRVWNLADGRLLHRLEGHTDWVRTVDYSSDGELLASAGNDRQIVLWDSASGQRRDRLAIQAAAIAAVRFSNQGLMLAAVGFEDAVRLYDVATQRLVAQLPAPCHDMRALAFSPDDQLLAAGGRSGSIRVYSLPRGDVVQEMPAHRQRIRAIAFSSDGSFVASAGEDRLVHVASLADGVTFRLPERPAKVLSLVFYGPQHLAVAGSDNLIRLWDVASREEIGCLPGHTGSIAALDCRDKVLVSAGYDTTVRVWDVGDQVADAGGRRRG
jgi:WD40 repeat protein